MVISMKDNCWKRARKQTYEKLHKNKHKTKEELDMSKTSNKPMEDETLSSNDKKNFVSNIPIVLDGLTEKAINLKQLTKISHNKKDYKINKIECKLPVYFYCTNEDGNEVLVHIQKDGTYHFLEFGNDSEGSK